MVEKISSHNENDYSSVNRYIDEQNRLRKAKSFWLNARSWALIFISVGLLAVLLAYAYSLLNKHYILKRVAYVQERVIEEKINEAISTGGISNSVNKLKMIGDNKIAIEELDKIEKRLENEKEKNTKFKDEIEMSKNKILETKKQLEVSVGELASFESEKINLLKQMSELADQIKKLEGESDEKNKLLDQLKTLEAKNKNIKNNFYLFSEEKIKVQNKDIRVMTRFLYKDLDLTQPISVDCYIDFRPSFGANLADLALGKKNENFNFDKVFSKNGFTKEEFKKIKKKNCRFLN